MLFRSKPVNFPDYSSKEKAQKIVWPDIEKMKADKKVFKETLVPKWLQEAKERESKYPVSAL